MICSRRRNTDSEAIFRLIPVLTRTRSTDCRTPCWVCPRTCTGNSPRRRSCTRVCSAQKSGLSWHVRRCQKTARSRHKAAVGCVLLSRWAVRGFKFLCCNPRGREVREIEATSTRRKNGEDWRGKGGLPPASKRIIHVFLLPKSVRPEQLPDADPMAVALCRCTETQSTHIFLIADCVPHPNFIAGVNLAHGD